MEMKITADIGITHVGASEIIAVPVQSAPAMLLVTESQKL
jgi:hypothetical protein